MVIACVQASTISFFRVRKEVTQAHEYWPSALRQPSVNRQRERAADITAGSYLRQQNKIPCGRVRTDKGAQLLKTSPFAPRGA